MNIFFIVSLLLAGCTDADKIEDETIDSDTPQDIPVEEDDGLPIEFEPTEAEVEYLSYWLEQDQDFVASLKWLPHFIHEQGELGICMKFDFENEQTVDGDLVESIRSKVEERIWEWQKGLVGQPNWIRDSRTPVYVFGIGVTPSVQQQNLPEDILVYENESADCPAVCSRFTYKHDTAPTYDECEHPTMSHFDFAIWYSDYSFGAAGHGGDWGTRLDWLLFLDELSSSVLRVTDHELGHVAGLPDIYTYPLTVNGYDVPDTLMGYVDTIQNFDYLMIRKVWELGWNQFYAE